MGIVKKTIHSKAMEGKDGKIQIEELIDPAMVILSDNAREMEMNLLNNARNNMVGNFWSIKWIFHETKEIKNRLQVVERKEGETRNERIHRLENRVNEIDKRMNKMEDSLHNTAN